jgi:hypothetical protein
LLPDQLPEAVQALAFWAVQLNVDAAPDVTVLGEAEIFMVGAAAFVLEVDEAAVTVTVVVWLAAPPAPEQVSSNFCDAERGPTDLEPFSATEPVQPFEAVQDVALLEVQLNVADPPLATVAGLADRETVGAGVVTSTVTVWLAEPPFFPEQVSVYWEAFVSEPVDCDPLVGWLPLQLPEAWQDFAETALHDSVALPLSTTLVALDVSVKEGAAVEVESELDEPSQAAIAKSVRRSGMRCGVRASDRCLSATGSDDCRESSVSRARTARKSTRTIAVSLSATMSLMHGV